MESKQEWKTWIKLSFAEVHWFVYKAQCSNNLLWTVDILFRSSSTSSLWMEQVQVSMDSEIPNLLYKPWWYSFLVTPFLKNYLPRSKILKTKTIISHRFDRKNLSCLWDRMHPFLYSYFLFGIVVSVPTGIIICCYYQIFVYARMCKNMVQSPIYTCYFCILSHYSSKYLWEF